MRIKPKDLWLILPHRLNDNDAPIPHNIRKIGYQAASSITQRIYCSRVHSNGNCTADCETNCGKYIRSAFSSLFSYHNHPSPPALLTIIMKDKAAIHNEDKADARRSADNEPVLPEIEGILEVLGT